MAELVALVDGFVTGVWSRLVSSQPPAIVGSGQHSPKSRPPAALTIVALVMEVTAAAREGADELVGHSADVPSNLIDIARTLVRYPDDDVHEWWVNALHDWSYRGLIALGIMPQLSDYVRGQCPACGDSFIVVQRQGERQRVPALEIVWDQADMETPLVQRVLCRACGQCWERAGNGLVDLVQTMNPGLLAFPSA